MARGVKNPEAPVEQAVERKHPRFVRATANGHYGQLREPGDVFENTLDLPIEGSSWLEPVDSKALSSEE